MEELELLPEELKFKDKKIGLVFTYSSYGSLEGIIISVGKYYKSPSFTLRARLSGLGIKCVVQDELANSIGAELSFEEVWANQRVMVEGIISYNVEGEAANIDVRNIIKIKARDISLERITDPDFTGGLSSYQYLERLRE